jgi:hypothetical protein
MALRDKLRERTQPYLQPDEHIQQVFQAQSGPSPYFILLTYLTLFSNRYYIVAVTDQSIVLVRTGMFSGKPKKGDDTVTRLPRQTRIGPLQGLWASTHQLGPAKLWIHKRFHSDVASADGALVGP